MPGAITDTGTVDYTQIEINFQERTQMRAQQSMSLTEPFITYVGGKGRETKTTFWGTNTLDQKSQRHESYPIKETPREAYWFGTMHFWDKELIDGDDQLFDATDAAGGLSEVWSAAAAREKDRLFINAAMGVAYRGRFGQSTPQALPASQIIPHGGTGLTAAKVKTAVSMIRRAHPMQNDPIVCMVTSSQINVDLMNEPQVISGDYNNDRPLKDLSLPYYFGSYFKIIEDLANYHPQETGRVVNFDPILPILTNGISTGTHIRYCVMWVKSAMRGKKDRPIQTKLHDESKDHGPDSKSLTVDFMEGGTRVNPLGVVVIECAETAPRYV
jgi:hypothetical protein